MTISKPHHWIVERFENGQATLLLGGRKVLVSRKQLPKNCKEGDVLSADFYLAKDEKIRRDSIARALLEELLKAE